MNQRLIVVFGLVALIAYADGIKIESLVKDNGYPFEEHTVKTEDGYLLKLHRIEHPPGEESSSEKRPVAFLMHGLSCSSIEYLLLGPEEALGFRLVKNGYDVWMGNARGNHYSRRHETLNPDVIVGKFWNYSWHEIGTKDLPAMIDYIREKTGQDQLTYFGHSQGTTVFLVMSSLLPKYQSYIKSAHLMTPLAFVEDLSSAFLEIASKVVALLNPLGNLVGNSEFRPNGTLTELAGAGLCNDKPRELCSDILFLLTGFNEVTVEPSIITDVKATTPAGASTKCFLHYFQLHDSNKFQQYDYGTLENLRRYNSLNPPVYPLENIKVATFLYWGEKDKLIHKPDVDRIASGLANVKRVHKIENATHQAPTYAPAEISRPLYSLIIEDANSYM